MPKPVILIVDDDLADMELTAFALRKGARGEFEIIKMADARKALAFAEAERPDMILLDYIMPILSGLQFLELLKHNRVPTRVIFVSAALGEEVAIHGIKLGASDWVLKANLSPLVPKVKRALVLEPTLDRKPTSDQLSHLDAALAQTQNLRDEIEQLKNENSLLHRRTGRDGKPSSSGKPKVFIVHGHNEAMKLQLKNYLQNTLKIGEPIILHEQPSQGRTIIEKFEAHANRADVAFVLLTPDDHVATGDEDNKQRRRARQNVIFEMGYFFAMLKRTSGRVLLLTQGKLELPSDISGVIYIDISNGIESAGEEIRRELNVVIKGKT